MKADQALKLLTELRAEAATLPPSTSSAEFNSWQQRTRSDLTRALGESHQITERFMETRWTPSAYTMGDNSAFVRTFNATVPEVQGLIDAAIFELDQLGDAGDGVDDAAFDHELWEHVSGHVASEEWGKAASQASIFTEDRIRKWAGRPAEEVGEKLMTAVFGERGEYRLGITDGEKQGWHRFAMGLSMALRNADAHRLQSLWVPNTRPGF